MDIIKVKVVCYQFCTLRQTSTPRKASQKLSSERKIALHLIFHLYEIDPVGHFHKHIEMICTLCCTFKPQKANQTYSVELKMV